MPDRYVRSTDGSDSDNGTTWALAKATTVGVAAIDAAGDRIFFSQSHNESSASSIAPDFAGTRASPSQIICGNDAAQPPTAVATTAVIATTSGDISFLGTFYAYGIELRSGVGQSSNRHINIGASGDVQRWESCRFTLGCTGTSARFNIGPQGTNNGENILVNPTVKFGHVSQALGVFCNIRIRGLTIDAAGSAITALIRNFAESPRAADVLIEASDLSAGDTAMDIVVVSGISGSGRLVLRNCKLPASWSGNLVNGASNMVGLRAEMYNCDSGDTNYRLWIEDFAGSIKSETTIVRTGGATDGTTALSWKMASSANAEYPAILLRGPDIVVWNDTTGSSKTVTLECVTDGVTLKDDEFWIEVQYLGTSGFPKGSLITDAKADVLATAANQTSSSETWTTTGLSSPVKQQASVTFTPQKKGAYIIRPVLAKASTTVYVCPLATVA